MIGGHDRGRLRRVINALGGLQKLEEQRAAQQLEQQQHVRKNLDEISDLANGDSLTGILFGDMSAKYSAGLADEMDALGEALRQSTGEALRHGKRIEKLTERYERSQLRDRRNADQRDLVEGLLPRRAHGQPVSGKLTGLKFR